MPERLYAAWTRMFIVLIRRMNSLRTDTLSWLKWNPR
jgi:hypothetical protein